MIEHIDRQRQAVLARIASAILDTAGESPSINQELPHDELIAKLRETKKIGLYRLRHELAFSTEGRTVLTAWVTTDLATRRSWVTVSVLATTSVPSTVQMRVRKFIEGWKLYPL